MYQLFWLSHYAFALHYSARTPSPLNIQNKMAVRQIRDLVAYVVQILRIRPLQELTTAFSSFLSLTWSVADFRNTYHSIWHLAGTQLELIGNNVYDNRVLNENLLCISSLLSFPFLPAHIFSILFPPFSFYFLSPCNFLFPYRNWERQGCVGGHGVPPRKVWGFGQNRSLISSKHRSNLNCLQALVSNPTSVVSVGLHEKGPQGCCVVSLVLEKTSFYAPTRFTYWGNYISFPQVIRAQERLFWVKCLVKRSRTSWRVWFIPKWSIVMHQTCFPYEPVGREHADKLLQDVTRQAVEKGNGSLCVELRRAHL